MWCRNARSKGEEMRLTTEERDKILDFHYDIHIVSIHYRRAQLTFKGFNFNINPLDGAIRIMLDGVDIYYTGNYGKWNNAVSIACREKIVTTFKDEANCIRKKLEQEVEERIKKEEKTISEWCKGYTPNERKSTLIKRIIEKMGEW